MESMASFLSVWVGLGIGLVFFLFVGGLGLFFPFFFCFVLNPFSFLTNRRTPEVKKIGFPWGRPQAHLGLPITKGDAGVTVGEVRAAGHGCRGGPGAQGELAGLMVGLLASERL